MLNMICINMAITSKMVIMMMMVMMKLMIGVSVHMNDVTITTRRTHPQTQKPTITQWLQLTFHSKASPPQQQRSYAFILR